MGKRSKLTIRNCRKVAQELELISSHAKFNGIFTLFLKEAEKEEKEGEGRELEICIYFEGK